MQPLQDTLISVTRNLDVKQAKTIRIKSMLELYVVEATRTVLRREGGGNPSDLADIPHVWICAGGAR